MKIKYEFVTGEILEVEVADALFEVYIEIEDVTRKHDKRESRRHVLLSVLERIGIQLSENKDIETDMIELEELNKLQEALKRLLPKQQELIFRVFFCGKSVAEVAKEEGVTAPAIRNRLNRAIRKLKEIMN